MDPSEISPFLEENINKNLNQKNLNEKDSNKNEDNKKKGERLSAWWYLGIIGFCIILAIIILRAR